jgi:hypothetical protein
MRRAKSAAAMYPTTSDASSAISPAITRRRRTCEMLRSVSVSGDRSTTTSPFRSGTPTSAYRFPPEVTVPLTDSGQASYALPTIGSFSTSADVTELESSKTVKILLRTSCGWK